jgi:predicted NBD/HSP70 family sugar kinase
MSKMYIGIDVGGTNIRVALFDNLCNPQILQLNSFLMQNNYNEDIFNIVTAIDSFKIKDIKSIGIGLPGVIDQSNLFLKRCAKINSWENRTTAEDLSTRYRCPVYIQNDALVAALGELEYGYGKNLKGKDLDFIFVVWGTGIGGTHIKVRDGLAFLSPMELGHTIIKLGGNMCRCGQRGCLQSYCAPIGIKDSKGISMEDLNETEWNSVIEHFAQGIVNLSTLNAVTTIIMGSSVSINNTERVHKIFSLAKKESRLQDLKYDFSFLGNQTGIFGTMALISKIQKGGLCLGKN